MMTTARNVAERALPMSLVAVAAVVASLVVVRQRQGPAPAQSLAPTPDLGGEVLNLDGIRAAGF